MSWGKTCRASVQAVAFAAAVSASCAASADVIVDWRQGSGNSGAHFTTANDVFGGNLDIELGLRAVERQVGTITPVGNVYSTDAGASPNPSRARWNFDIHVQYEGSIADLDGLSLEISTVGGSAPSQPTFDLLAARAAIDCHVLNCTNGPPSNPDAQGDEDPLHFYQASQNPVFFPWFISFDMFQPGQYFFTLTALEGQDRVSTSIEVRVVPEPVSMALFGTALACLGFAVRRRRR